MKKKIFLFVAFCLIFIASYFFIASNLNQKKFVYLTKFLNEEQKFIIKKYIFPYSYIKRLENEPSQILAYEIKRKKKLESIIFEKIQDEKNLNYNDLKLELFYSKNRLMVGAHSILPGSAYLDYFKEDLFIASPIGILGYGKIVGNKIEFKQIENNIENFIGINQFKKSNGFAVKDLKIFNEKVYISYSNEVKKNCWNTSVIYADINYTKLNFKKLFAPDECVHEYKNPDKVFVSHQAGGRIVGLDKDHILLTQGEFRNRYLAQKKSIFGKIIKININSVNRYEIFAMGLRNSQGLYINKQNNFLLITDHGPRGGDEINFFDLKQNNKPNYGWPVASYGEHYGKDQMIYYQGGKNTNLKRAELYKKYPLLKSHEKNGFVEPIKYFEKSVAISEITCLKNSTNCVASSLKDKSLYFFTLDKGKKVQDFKRINVGERIRDIIFYKNKLIIFLEDTASIGIINFEI